MPPAIRKPLDGSQDKSDKNDKNDKNAGKKRNRSTSAKAANTKRPRTRVITQAQKALVRADPKVRTINRDKVVGRHWPDPPGTTTAT